MIFFTSAFAGIHKGYYKHQLIKKIQIDKSVQYSHITIGQRSVKHYVHILEVNLKDKSIKLSPLKIQYEQSQLNKLQFINHYYDSVWNINVLASVNSNFWKAYSNYPIGVLVENGEVIEFNSYKKWSLLLLDSNNLPFIQRIKLSAMVFSSYDTIHIDYFNRRSDSLQCVIYNNKYYSSIPNVGNLDDEFSTSWAILNEKLLNDDSTETLPDSASLYEEIRNEFKTANIEFPLKKYFCRFLEQPAINKKVKCVVELISGSEIPVPKNGFILSVGDSINAIKQFKVGDTLTYFVATDKLKNRQFENIITGTPRLISAGNPKHEAYYEGSTGRRFISRQLARTAVGFNKDKSKLYLVTVEYTSHRYGRKGANLDDMAAIMKSLGCYEALNLDGGGSSIMVIDGKNVMNSNNPESGRRISTGFGIIKK